MPLRILGSRVDAVTSQDALHKIQNFLLSGRAHHVITGNTLMLLEAEKDPQLQQILEGAALVVPESSGILWASRTLGQPLAEFTPGVDFMLAICRMAEEKGHPVFLLGSAPGIAEAAGQELLRRYPKLKIAGTHHGFFSSAGEVIELIRQAKPSLLFVGMGMPAQEKWIARHLQTLPVPVVMGVGEALMYYQESSSVPHHLCAIGG